MQWLHFFARNTLAILGGILFGAFIGVTSGLVTLILCIVSSLELSATLLLGAIAASLGFMYGVPQGFLMVTYCYKKYIEGDLNYPLPDILRLPNPLEGRHRSANNLLQKIDGLTQAPVSEPLTEDQIREFREIIIKENNLDYKNKLEKYENYINDYCGLSYEPIPSLEDPITIQGVHPNNNQTWYKTYDKKMFREWVVIRGEDVVEPTNNYRLADPQNKIQFIPGLPGWIYDFISLVKSILVHKKSPVEPSSLSDTVDIIPDEKPLLPKKIAIATARQHFYKNLSFFSDSSTAIQHVDDEKQFLPEGKNNDSHVIQIKG